MCPGLTGPLRAIAVVAIGFTAASCHRGALAATDLSASMPSDAGSVDAFGACLADAASCTTFPQCGCATGNSCDVVGTNGNTGCRAIGTTPNWSACAGAPCMGGSTCSIMAGVCAPFCASDADCGGPYHTCISTFPASHVCTPLCDPVDPQNAAPPYTACGPGVGCLPLYGEHGVSYCSVSVDAAGTQGAPCATRGCAVGFVCVSQQCRKACHVGSNSDCPAAGLVCVQMTSPVDGSNVLVGTTPLGYCN